MKKIMLSLFYCAFALTAWAQTPPPWVFATSIGGVATDDAADIVTDNSGNVYVIGSFSGVMEVGTLTTTSKGGNDIYVAKFSPTGTPLWLKGYGSVADDVGYAITTDGTNVYWTGTYKNTFYYTASNFLPLNGFANKPNLAVIKLDASGNVAWAQSSGGETILANNVYPKDIQYIKGGGVVVGGIVTGEMKWGTTVVNNVTVRDTCYDCGFVSRYGTNTGEYEWTYTVRYILNATEDCASSIMQLSTDENHNIYVIGNMTSRNVGKPCKAIFPNMPLYGVGTPGLLTLTGWGQRDMFMLKLGGDGLRLAVQNGGYNVPPSNYNFYTDGSCIWVDTTEDVVYMGGAFRDAMAYSGMTGSINATGGNSFLLKTDLNGNLLWERHTTATSTDGGSGLWQLSGNGKGGVYFGISAQTNCDWYGHPASGNTSSFATALLGRVESNGNTRWTKTIDAGGFHFVNPPAMRAIQSATTDECWVAGAHDGFGIYFDAYLVAGNNYSPDGLVAKIGTSQASAIEPVSLANDWRIYPNPAQQEVFVAAKTVDSPTFDYFLYDMQGKAVQKGENLSSATARISLAQLPAGTYLLELKQENKVGRSKLVVY